MSFARKAALFGSERPSALFIAKLWQEIRVWSSLLQQNTESTKSNVNRHSRRSEGSKYEQPAFGFVHPFVVVYGLPIDF